MAAADHANCEGNFRYIWPGVYGTSPSQWRTLGVNTEFAGEHAAGTFHQLRDVVTAGSCRCVNDEARMKSEC
jgi:hypothetical protein